MAVFPTYKSNPSDLPLSQSAHKLSDGPDWSFPLLEQYEAEIDRIAKDFKLDTYPIK